MLPSPTLPSALGRVRELLIKETKPGTVAPFHNPCALGGKDRRASGRKSI